MATGAETETDIDGSSGQSDQQFFAGPYAAELSPSLIIASARENVSSSCKGSASSLNVDWLLAVASQLAVNRILLYSNTGLSVTKRKCVFQITIPGIVALLK